MDSYSPNKEFVMGRVKMGKSYLLSDYPQNQLVDMKIRY